MSINGQLFELDPHDVGLTFATEEAVARAMTAQKDGLTDWLRAFSEEVDVPVEASLDAEMLEEQLRAWELVAIENPAFEGSIEIAGREVRIPPGKTIRFKPGKNLRNLS